MGKGQRHFRVSECVRRTGCLTLAGALAFSFSPLCVVNAYAAQVAGTAAVNAANTQGNLDAVFAASGAARTTSGYGEALIGQESYMVWVESDGVYRATFTAPQYLSYAMCNTQGVQDATFSIKDSAGKTLVSHGAWDYEMTPFVLKEGERVTIEITGATHYEGDDTVSLYTKIEGIPEDSTDYGNFKGDWATSSKARISSIASKVTDATYDMLANYINAGHLDLATTVHSAPAGAKVLKKLSDQIAATGGTDTQKAIKMAAWSAHNVKYDSGVAHGAIDTFYERKADCKGFAALTAELMRLTGIPAVFVAGYNASDGGGLSKTTFAKAAESGDYNHAWVYAYTDGQWRMYDPLFGVYASTDKAAQSKNYYPWHVAGITPTYQGEDLSLAGSAGFGFFLVNQRVVFFANGKPNSMLESGYSPDLMLDFDGIAMFGDPLNVYKGYSYWEGDSEWAGKEFEGRYLDELLAGGPVQDGEFAFARSSSGILYAGSFPTDAASGEQLFITYNGRAQRFTGDVSTVQLSKGRPVIEVGTATRLLLPAEYGNSDYRIEFSVNQDDTAGTIVKADGTVTCKRAGNAFVDYSVYATDDGRFMGSGDIQYEAYKSTNRKANYTDDPSKWIRNPELPDITYGARLAAGSTVTSGKLKYTVLAGQKTVSVKVRDTAAAGSLKSISIPANITDKKGNSYVVTTIAKNGFKGCPKLKSVKVAGGNLTTIGSAAFTGTKNLTSVAIASTTKLKIVKGAFKNAGKAGGKGLVVKVSSSKLSAYKKLILAKGGNKKLTVKGA